MPTQKLTDKTIKNAKALNSGRAMLWDSVVANEASLPGSFGLRVTANGVKSWIIMYRIEDAKNPGKTKQRYRKIGSYPSIPLSEAREAAREALKLAGQGVDPIQARAAEKQKAAAVKTVKEAVSVFIKRHVKQKNRSWEEIERVFNVYVVPALGEKPLPEVKPGDIHDLLDPLMDAGHGYMANRLFAHTRKFFNWCAERHWISEPPTKNISPPADEAARDRVLGNDEFKSLWFADVGWPFGPYFKLLMLTGQRRNEVAGMKWDHIDFKNKVWTIPKEDTKNKRKHEVPLSPQAIEVLQAVPKEDNKTKSLKGKYVFTTTGKTHISGFSKAKKRCDEIIAASRLEAAGKEKWTAKELSKNLMPPWRIHDLRRSVASGMAEIGVAPHVIEKVLNHSTGQISGVAAVYNRHTYLREKTDALTAWGRKLESIVQVSGNNVIEMAGVEK